MADTSTGESLPSPAHRKSVVTRVANEVRQRLLRGLYPPNTLLPTERELALELGASRRSVSAAMSVLVREGLIEQTRGRGTRALSPLEQADSVVIGVVHMLPTREMSAEPLHILEGVQETLSRLHRKYELVQTYWRSAQPTSRASVCVDAIHTLAERYRALLFIATLGAPEQILALEQRKVLLVVANLEEDLDVTATWVDHYKTTRHAVNVLASLGHQRIALLTRAPDRFFYAKVRDGYAAGLAAMNLPFDESLVVLCPEPRAFSAYVAAKQLFQQATPRPTALVMARDYMAEGACQAITEAGLAIGTDVSLIGFDDVSWPVEPRFLTTFREPCYEMGARAAEMLVERILTGWRPPEKQELEAPFLLRQSAGLAPRPPGAHGRRDVEAAVMRLPTSGAATIASPAESKT